MSGPGIKKMLGLGSRNKVAFDIGSSSVKFLEVSEISGRLSLVNFGARALPSRSSDAVSAALKSLLLDGKIVARDAAISVSGPSVITRFISMPRMRDDELKTAVRFEAEKLIPFNIAECVIDFQTIPRVEHDNKVDLLLVVAKKDLVDERVRLVENAGFTVTLIDIDAFAATNAFLKNFPPANADTTSAIINFGATYTNLSIVRGERVHFVRDIAIGGNDFSAVVGKSLGIDAAAAEKIKASPKEKAGDIANFMRATFNNLLDETRLSFGYYENQSGRAIDAVYISGGGVGLCGIEEAFQEAFGSKPLTWDPLKFFDITVQNAAELEKSRCSYAVAAGLTLR